MALALLRQSLHPTAVESSKVLAPESRDLWHWTHCKHLKCHRWPLGPRLVSVMVPGLEQPGQMDWPPNLVALRLLGMVDGTLGLLSRPPRNGEVDTFE